MYAFFIDQETKLRIMLTYLYTSNSTDGLDERQELVSPEKSNGAIVQILQALQNGFLKNAQTYEIIAPEEVGADSSKIVLTARSGRSALAFRFRKLGHEFTRDEVDVLYQNFLQIADAKKEVHDADLVQMVATFVGVTAESASRN